MDGDKRRRRRWPYHVLDALAMGRGEIFLAVVIAVVVVGIALSIWLAPQ
jgi:hypothetical protein